MVVTSSRIDPDVAIVPLLRMPIRSATASTSDRMCDENSTVVLATESDRQMALTEQLVRRGMAVVATADDAEIVMRQLTLHETAVASGARVVVGAAHCPGLSSLLAAWQFRAFDQVSSISVATFGTGGPACARQHHRSASRSAPEVHRGVLRSARPGSGRELVWFPEPIGPADCYRAGLIEPFLLHQAFPDVARIEARQAATRRDRLTPRLPMLRSPHEEGRLGPVWVEVRGVIDGHVEHRAVGSSTPQATAAAATAAAFAVALATSRRATAAAAAEDRSEIGTGVRSAAMFENVDSLLKIVSNDVRLWTYDGSRIDLLESPSLGSAATRDRLNLAEIVAKSTIADSGRRAVRYFCLKSSDLAPTILAEWLRRRVERQSTGHDNRGQGCRA